MRKKKNEMAETDSSSNKTLEYLASYNINKKSRCASAPRFRSLE